MRILHISDIHWRGIARHKEYTKAFEKLFNDAKNIIKPDVIVNTGDTFHTKTQGITPEYIERMSWMLRCMGDIAPTYTLLGNHDGNLTNLTRQDAITPIHNAVNHPNTHLFSTETVRVLDTDELVIDFDAYSPFDKDSWDRMKLETVQTRNRDNKHVRVALFHGSVNGCIMDNGWALPEGECKVTDFVGYDFVLMGDIHKRQAMAYRVDHAGTTKQWMGYPGSFIQQSYGEEESKGVLIWDIRARNDWDVTYHQIETYQPFGTYEWQGTPEATIREIVKTNGSVKPGSRFRISSQTPILEHLERQTIDTLKDTWKADDVIFKSEFQVRLDGISTDTVQVDKKNLRNSADSLWKLYEEFLETNKSMYNLTTRQQAQAKEILTQYLATYNNTTPDVTGASGGTWSIRWLEWDNTFGYGENNKINFDALDGLVGIFGPNQIGKSSIVGTICYALFNGTDRGSIKNNDVVNWGKDYCSAKIRFSVAGDDYVVERKTTKTYNKSGKLTDKVVNSVQLWKVIADDSGNEILDPRNSISTTDTDKEIRRLIGSQEDFLLTAFAAQDDLHKFIKEGSTKRKKHLNRFLELDIFESLFKMSKEEFAKLSSMSTIMSEEEWMKQISSISMAMERNSTKVDKLTEEMNTLSESRDKLNAWFAQYEHALKTATMVKQLFNERDSVAHDITATQEEIAKFDSLITDLQQEKVGIEAKIAGQSLTELELKMSTNDKTIQRSYEQHAELKELESKYKALEKESKKLQLVPCEGQYPKCMFITSAHEASVSMPSVKESLERARHEFTQKQYEVDRVIQQQEQISKDLKELSSDISAISLLENKIQLAESQAASAQKRLETFVAKKERLDATCSDMILVDSDNKSEYDEKKQALGDITVKLLELNKENVQILSEIGVLKNKLDTKTQEMEAAKELVETASVHQSIMDALSKRGIPAMILQTQLPTISYEANKLLQQANVNFHVELSADTSSNDMDVFLVNPRQGNDKKSIIELCSGMEKTMISLALRFALIRLSSLAKPNFVIVDEGFGSLDANNMPGVLSLMRLISSHFKSVLLIAHEDYIKESVDTVIEIEKNSEHARVTA